MKNLISRVLIIISALAMYTFVSVVLSIPVLLLWNWLMPTIFGITKIYFRSGMGYLFTLWSFVWSEFQ